MTLDYMIVFILGVVADGWSIPVGLLLGLPPSAVYVTGVLGGVTLAVFALAAGGRARDWATDRYFPDADERLAGSRAADLVERWGVPGLATVGATVLGPTATLIAALALGVDRRRFLAWSSGAPRSAWRC